MLRNHLIVSAVVASAVALAAGARAGSLDGSFSIIPNVPGDPATISLTSVGTTDWAVFGIDPTDTRFAPNNTNLATPFAADDSKLGGSGAIGDALNLMLADDSAGTGFTSTAKFLNDGAGGGEGVAEFSWTDGAVDASLQEPAALVVRSTGKTSTEYLKLDIAASTATQRLRLYVTGFNSSVNLTASLSDSSATPLDLTDLFGAAPTTDSMGVLTLDFAANSGAANLEIALTEGQTVGNNFQSFGIAAAALGEVLIPGDTNGDGDVDLDDFAAIRDNFRDNVATRGEGDLNEDGVVNFYDFREWKANYPLSLAGVDLSFLGSVPEPTSLALLLPLAAGVAGRRRVRS